MNIWQTGQKRKRRKKDRADDPSDIEGWKGPWARFKDEKTNEELAASGEIRAEMDEILEKRRAKKALRRANRDEEEVSNKKHQVEINFYFRSMLQMKQQRFISMILMIISVVIIFIPLKMKLSISTKLLDQHVVSFQRNSFTLTKDIQRYITITHAYIGLIKQITGGYHYRIISNKWSLGSFCFYGW